MLEVNRKIILQGSEAIHIIKELSFILCSLHDMGSYYCDKNKYDYEKETTRFIDESLIVNRLADIRKLIVEKFNLELGDDDMDDIERESLNIPYWKIPGDNFEGQL